MTSLSVIVLTRNRLAKLTECLTRLSPQLIGGDEIVIIDTGSEDGTIEKFQEHEEEKKESGEKGINVGFHRFTGPGSWAEARNFALDRAAGPLLAFLDDDCYAAGDWAERGRRNLETCDAVGGLVTPHAIEVWPEWWNAEMGWLVGLSVPGHLGPDAGRVYYPFTANVWVRAEVARKERFQELGGEFGPDKPDDQGERYRTGREDAEWWRRLRVAGYRTRFDPKLIVEHDIDARRLDFSYLQERAKRDGEAWARREGAAEDLEPLAYQWWRHAARREPGDEAGPGSTESRRRLHELMRLRHAAALRALASKVARAVPGAHSASTLRRHALMRSGSKFCRDRARTVARRLLLTVAPPKRWPLPEAAPSRIAVVALGFLGDLVILQSCLRGLVRSCPELRIDLLASPAAEAIFSATAGVRLTALPSADPATGGGGDFLRRWIAESRPELIFAPFLHGPWGPALVRLRGLGAPVIAFDGDEELERRIDRERVGLKVQRLPGEHESRNLSRLFALGRLDADPEPPRIEPSPGALERAKAWREGLGSAVRSLPLLMLNPEAGKPAKEWTGEAWSDSISKLLEELPHVFAVNSSRARPELEEKVRSAVGDNPRVQWFRDEPLDFLIALLSICEGIVTVDAGPQHLAHALDVPSLTLYGPMDERRWADAWQRPIHRTLRGGTHDLTPEELRGLPVNHLMSLITPGALIDEVRAWKKHLKTSSDEG